MSVRVPLREAADSMAKASTPEPFSRSRTSNWVARAGGLPDYIQHIAHDLMEKRGKSESEAIEMAVGIVKNPPRNWGPEARAAAAKAAAEWEAKKARTAAKSAVREGYRPLLVDEIALRDAALSRLAAFESVMGLDGMVRLLGEGMLAEAAAWSPTMKRTACAPQEIERHEVYDGGQHVGTLSRSKGFKGESQWRAFAVNGTRVTDYNTSSKPDAVKALETHLAEAPARVITMPATGKYLVAQPSTYSGETTYRSFPNEATARHAAGLPQSPTVPETSSKVQSLAETLRLDLITVAGLDIPPLARVQEARARDPLAS